MKKLSLLGQILSRDEMKNILGGGSGTAVTCNGECNCAGGCYTFLNVRSEQVTSYCASKCANYGRSFNGICTINCYS